MTTTTYASNAQTLGYERRPFWTIMISGCFFSIALAVLSEKWLNPQTINEFWFQDGVSALIAAFCILLISRITFGIFVVISVFAILDHFLRNMSLGWSSPPEIMMLVFWFTVPLYVAMSNLHIVYLDPKTRWWARPPRYQYRTLGTAYHRGVKFPIVTMDISSKGAFIKIDERLFTSKKAVKDDKRMRNKPEEHPFMNAYEKVIAQKSINKFPRLHDTIRIIFQARPSLDNPYVRSMFETEAQIVWETKQTDPIQHGAGLKFINLSWCDKLRLKRYIRLLKLSDS